MDLDAIKSRLNQLQNTQTNAFWKPQPGKSIKLITEGWIQE